MAVNKKGMFFTLIIILLIITLVFSIILYNVPKFQSQSVVTETRVNTMQDFINDVELDLSRAMYISGFRAISSIEDYITTNVDYIDDSEFRINELMMDGTLYSQEAPLMKYSTLPDWMSRIIFKGKQLNINTNFTNPVIIVNQIDPWNVHIQMNVTLSVNDSTNLARWNKHAIIEAKIPIIGFEDPTYVINTFGRVTNLINRTRYENNYTQGANVNNLYIHATNSLYTLHNDAPNFLMRLEGNLNPDINGIESQINLNELQSQGVLVYDDRSVVDYLYWLGTSTTNYHITGMPGWYLLDSSHLEKYNSTSLAY